MKERIETLERVIPKLKANKKILPLKVQCMEWELRALKAEQTVKNCSIPVKSSCNCYADQWEKREDNTIYCTGCGKDV